MTTKFEKILIYIAGLILAMIVGTGCEPQFEPSVSQHELLMQYPSEYLSVPVGTAYEFGISFQQAPAIPSTVNITFDEECLTIKHNDQPINSGQSIKVSLDGEKQSMRFTAIGNKTGVHRIEAKSKTSNWVASGAFSITVKNYSYTINLIDEVLPTLRVGEQKALQIEAVDIDNPNHLFYTTPGYMVSARSLGDVPTIIDLGAELTWNNFIEPFDSIARSLNWQDNKFSVMYKSFRPGDQFIEFAIKSPQGEISRTVYPLHVDSSKVNLIPNRGSSDTISITEAYEVNYKVDYFNHPHNQLSCMWEPLAPADPYSQSPKLFLDGKMNPEAGVWLEYRRTDIFGFSAYPIAPNKGGISKQGFRLHVQDMYGWRQTFEYRFDVKMSEYGFRVIEPTVTPLLQNNLYSCQFELSNYHKGKYRYKFVRPYDIGIDAAVTLYDYTYSTLDKDVWYDLDLSGSDGKRFLHSVQMGHRHTGYDGIIDIVIEDEFGVQKSSRGIFRFELNAISIISNQQPLSIVVGQSTTFNLYLVAPRPDNITFENGTIEFRNYEPLYESIEIDGRPLPTTAPYILPISNKTISVKYTAKSAVSKSLDFGFTSWTGQQSHESLAVNSIDNCGSFTITTDKSLYEVPFASGQISQDISVALASDIELAGLYDYNPTYQNGTTISISIVGKNSDRVVALDNNGGTIELSSTPQLLKYTLGRTIKLRHFATVSSDNTLNSRVTLTVTRKDGRVTYTSYNLSMADCGAFTATSDKSSYLIPYDDSRVSQDITVSLASEREAAGLYDYNSTTRTGTKISYTRGGNKGRLVVVTPSGQEIELSSTAAMLQYAVGKTIKLRHYPDATVNLGSIENVRITVIRKDGVLAQLNYKLTAEDKAFVVEKSQPYWIDQPVNVKGSGNMSIRNISKYYKGSYRLHSSEYNSGPSSEPYIVPILTQELPLPKAPVFNKTISANLYETSNKPGRVSIKRITIADDNGYTVWYENDGTDVYFYVEK